MSSEKTSLIFSIGDKVGGLADVLEIFKTHHVNLSRIESRPSKTDKADYDFFVDIEDSSKDKIQEAVEALRTRGFSPNLPNGSSGSAKPELKRGQSLLTEANIQSMQWFPRKISDLDEFAVKPQTFGEALDADHPGFRDKDYVTRRNLIATIAKEYKFGEKIPKIPYSEVEIATWREVYTNLKKLYAEYACKAHNYVLPLLEQNCGFGPDTIPQLEDVSRFLHDCTGWTLRPVQGLLSSRDFLNGFAFRVFHATQYIRHNSTPLYTPEPDCCHELLGHIPLFADPDFAEFSHEIGLASLGASDEDIERLATCYWFTVEFGLCKEDGKIKAYGAGLLSSFGELAYSVGQGEKKPEYVDFDPFVASKTKYPITEYQPKYFVAESFASATQKLKEFSATMKRPFGIRYNPYTQSVEILDNKDKLTTVMKEIQSQLSTLNVAIQKLPTSTA